MLLSCIAFLWTLACEHDRERVHIPGVVSLQAYPVVYMLLWCNNAAYNTMEVLLGGSVLGVEGRLGAMRSCCMSYHS